MIKQEELNKVFKLIESTCTMVHNDKICGVCSSDIERMQGRLDRFNKEYK